MRTANPIKSEGSAQRIAMRVGNRTPACESALPARDFSYMSGGLPNRSGVFSRSLPSALAKKPVVRRAKAVLKRHLGNPSQLPSTFLDVQYATADVVDVAPVEVLGAQVVSSDSYDQRRKLIDSCLAAGTDIVDFTDS